MQELLNHMMTPELQLFLIIVLVIIVALYLLSVIWVIRDARNRDTSAVAWGIIALIPIIGLIAYCLMRPPLLTADQDEQDLELALKRRQLMKFGECSRCGYPVEDDYVLCPNCHSRLKNLCPTCHHALEPTWSICPFCTTRIFEEPRKPETTK